jgi:Spy/CpxP family protein refolding chaperone
MTKLVVIIGFAVAFAAGLIIGIESRRSGAAATPAPTVSSAGPSTRPMRRGGGWLNSELNLSPDQQQRLNRIWSEMARNGRREQEEKRRALRSERDEEIAALVGEAKKGQYEAIQAHYSDQLKTLDRESRAAFQTAVEDTRQVLTPEQRARYDELLARHQSDRGEHGREGRGEPGRGQRMRQDTGTGGGATPGPATLP